MTNSAHFPRKRKMSKRTPPTTVGNLRKILDELPIPDGTVIPGRVVIGLSRALGGGLGKSDRQLIPQLCRERPCTGCATLIPWKANRTLCFECWRARKERELVAQGKIYHLQRLPTDPPNHDPEAA